MVVIERIDETDRITDVTLRHWIRQRMTELNAEGFTVCLWIVEPDDDVLTVCARACWGVDQPPPWSEVSAVIEYVEEHPTFWAAVVPAHHEGGLILVLPKDVPLDPVWRAELANLSITPA